MNSLVISVKKPLAKRKLLAFKEFIKRSETVPSVVIPQETKADQVIDIGRQDTLLPADFIR